MRSSGSGVHYRQIVLGGSSVADRFPRQPLWTAERHNRLIEMLRARHTMEEIARELSLPLDEIEAQIERLTQEEHSPHPYD
jgi:hypothetical protein